ncbi:hypothetical protein B5M47_02925 [candidate division CPR3 bacterium 4484_211]|uniref:AbiEi antitoxin C-terminal domain-containing protein n=1 Tax=candidate division CPR3 bacterium 4484_211 TaxID=1968527 RepID=A0A1W9NXI5_UNCC3|nr:MAG: hypothetical protein B5M47_02925 [candidate division CPR3 bacterium 4484_211]
MSTITLIKKLQSLDKGYFTMADMQKITDLPRDSLKVAINRLIEKEILTRIKRGVYQLGFSQVDVPKIANQLYYPSYLSFGSALSRYGVLSQVPYTQTFATTRRSKKMTLWETKVEFRQLRKDLFFGYRMEGGVYIAELEKALLDQLYMVSRGRGSLNIEELDLKEVDKELLKKYAQKFPAYIKKLLDKVEEYIGTTPITDERKERIVWQ